MTLQEMNECQESPEYVRMSAAAAIALDFRKGRFYRNARTYCINLLQTYPDGCKANCLYCGQARDAVKDGACERLIRVGWPRYSLNRVISTLKKKQNRFKRVCVAMLFHPGAENDLIAIINRLKEEIRLPLSTLITPTNLTRVHLERLYEIGTDTITIALDTASKPLFTRIRGKAVKSPHKFDRYLAGLKEARKIFDQGRVGVHLIVGLGETEFEMTSTIQQMYDLDINVHLFSFYPEEGSALGMRSPPPLGQYRRIQLARYLIEAHQTRWEDMKFNEQGQIVDFGLPYTEFEKVIVTGTPFETSGCTGCNRPFANFRPSEPIRDFPFTLTQEDLAIIQYQIRDYSPPAPIPS